MWNPSQYERFKSERAQPFHDLLAMVEPRPEMRVIDLGCGTGELTRALHEHLKAKETLGIDSSESMLQKSASFTSEALRFEKGDIGSFASKRKFDLVFSNAAVHWVPDHEQLFAHLAVLLVRYGQMAIQMPANHAHASHRIAVEVATSFGIEAERTSVLRPEQYAATLHRLGFARQHVRLQVYGHLLASSEDVVEWVKGSTLTPYQSRLSPEDFTDYLAQYRERLIGELGAERPYFYTFNRVLVWAAL